MWDAMVLGAWSRVVQGGGFRGGVGCRGASSPGPAGVALVLLLVGDPPAAVRKLLKVLAPGFLT